MKFNEKLAILRKKNKYSQKDLSQELGISIKTLSNYEKGLTYPKRIDTFNRLAKIFNVSVPFLKDDRLNFTSNMATSEEISSSLQRLTMLFSSSKLSQKEKDDVLKAIIDVYFSYK